MEEQPEEKPKPKTQEEIMADNFDAKQKDMSERVKEVAAAMKKTSTILEAEHILFDVRQDLVDYRRELAKMLAIMHRSFKRLKDSRMMQHKGNKLTVLPSTPTEKKIMDDSYFAKVQELFDRYDAQYDWVKESISGCDQMANGISYHIKLASLLGGNAGR